MPEEKKEKYLRLKDVCKIYGVSEKVVYRLVRAKRIPYCKFGKLLLFEDTWIKFWLRDNERALAAWFNYELCPNGKEDNNNDSQENEERKRLVSRLLY